MTCNWIVWIHSTLYETFSAVMIGAETKGRDRGWSSQTNEMISDTTRLPWQKTMILLSWQIPSRTLRWCFRFAWNSETNIMSSERQPNRKKEILTCTRNQTQLGDKSLLEIWVNSWPPYWNKHKALVFQRSIIIIWMRVMDYKHEKHS